MHGRTAAIALAATLGWAILLVATRIVLHRFGLNAWAFSLVQLFVGGAAMFALGGRSTIAWSSLLMPSTWIYGALRVVSTALSAAALLYVSVAQDTLLAAVNVPLAMLGAMALSARRPMPAEWTAHGVIVAGILALAASLPGGLANPAVLLELVSETAVVASTMLIERHPENRHDSVAARCRFTGTVLMVTALLFVVVWAGIGALGVGIGSAALAFGSLGAAVAAPALWIAGSLVGALGRGPVMYLALLAIRDAGTQTYLAALALLPLVGLGLETAAAQAGLLPMPHVMGIEAMAGVLVIGGSMTLVWLRLRR